MKHRLVVPVMLIVAFSSSVALGSLFIKVFSHAELAQEADLVVIGQVTEKESVWTEGKTQIVTFTTVTVEDVLKGDPLGATVTVRQLGGRIDGVTASIDGDAVLAPGEEVLLFLRRIDGLCYLVGMSQGKLSVVREGDQAFLVDGPSPASIPPHGKGLMTLDEMVDIVLDAVTEGGAK